MLHECVRKYLALAAEQHRIPGVDQLPFAFVREPLTRRYPPYTGAVPPVDLSEFSDIRGGQEFCTAMQRHRAKDSVLEVNLGIPAPSRLENDFGHDVTRSALREYPSVARSPPARIESTVSSFPGSCADGSRTCRSVDMCHRAP